MWNQKNMKLWHETLMDAMILNPRASREDLAAQFGVTTQTITNLTTSDLFKLQLAERRERMGKAVEDTALSRLYAKTARLAEVTVDKLTEEIEKPGSDVSIDGIRDTAEMALKSLGFGQSGGKPAPTTVQTTVVVVDREVLAEARARIRGQAPLQVIDAQSTLPAA